MLIFSKKTFLQLIDNNCTVKKKKTKFVCKEKINYSEHKRLQMFLRKNVEC